jgi:uncharacterized LabA/DUF88 family protein
MADKMRVRIFIDFWNFQLCWNECHSHLGAKDKVQIPWKDLPLILSAEAGKGQPVRFTGAIVYASIDPNNQNDKKLKNWLFHGLSSYTGYSIVVKQRKPRKTFKCQEENCKAPVTHCPKCGTQLKGTVEKGIDAAVITDLLTQALDDNYDMGILISGDADYAPAVEYIQKKTDKQIVQAHFRNHGDELRKACWDHIFFDDLMGKLQPVAGAKQAGA